MKKRIISILMTAVMVFSFAVTAMATPTTTTAKAKTTPITKITTPVVNTSVRQTYTVTLSKLFVRSGAGISHSKLGILTKGTKVTGVVTKGWLKFSYMGKTAYCSANYLKTLPTTATATAKAKTTPITKITTPVINTSARQTYTVTLSKLFVRSGAGISHSKLGILSKGTKVTGVVTKGWLKFSYMGKTAYCSASYLKKVSK
jgi:uncharacterized protein YgiM (DUF1202 family)